MSDYKSNSFVAHEKVLTADNQPSSLWGEGEKSFLEDVTMNLIDDDVTKNLKGQTAMKWDPIKKKYVLKKVDREGKVIAEKRNESGKKITKKMKEKKKEQSIYKKWQQRTHLSLQKTGEMEDFKSVDQAKRASDARRTLKDFKKRHGKDLMKGEDAKSYSKMLEKKKTKMISKIKENAGKSKKQR
uniref:DBP10 C-terminal domain-containing protein n=1 Tax=Strombidium inclinatum TaxID=197538 RepID=A0A7S3IUR7_9SPIT|mmetsp:Transcript_41812/g.63891  ORF Transcript_41812/g.63891 Transcript_41812/m.63891 type:complete len:185 (+) Transcript_41812:1998-2552(+)